MARSQTSTKTKPKSKAKAKAKPPVGSAAWKLMPKNRLEAFSDGVLAIVITILVLELQVPDVAPGGSLISALADEWRSYLGYLISFVIVGGAWISHANATRMISKADPVLFRLTLVWLLFLSLIPFTTSIMTNFVETADEKTGVIVYGLNLVLASALLTGVIRYAAAKPVLASSDTSDEDLLSSVRERNILMSVQVFAVLCALVMPALAVTLYLVVALLFVVAPLVTATRTGRRSRAKSG